MLPQILKKSDLAAWVTAVMADRCVAGPVLKETSPADPSDLKFGWEYLDAADELRLDYTTTVLGPKKFLWPSRQKLVEYSLGGDPAPKAVIDHQPQVLFGVHPCDLTAIGTLDQAFGKDIPDPHYLARRADTAIVGLDCGCECDASSFCLDMGSLYPETGYDVMLTPLADAYFVEVKTAAGEALVKKSKATPAAKADMEARQAFVEAKRAAFHHKLPCEAKYLPEVLDASYDSLVWEAIARRCFSCGSCNTTCPTCYCFDVYDDVAVDLTKGCRVRRYDSCQLDPFAEVAGGESFRKDRWSRLRHRMFRKGKYILEQTGRPGCVGCGRCERACVAGISIRDTFTQIAGSR
jgi:sulfhydrogenase subunit beta (sulfur reductase)